MCWKEEEWEWDFLFREEDAASSCHVGREKGKTRILPYARGRNWLNIIQFPELLPASGELWYDKDCVATKRVKIYLRVVVV